jgi:superfamily II DNA/RNA helicase
MKNPQVVKWDATHDLEPDIEHVVMEVYREDKFQVLVRLLREKTDGTTLVFGRTKHGVRKIGQRLSEMGFNLVVLQGNLTQGQRDKAIEQFRSGRVPILVATNVAARGLDIVHIARVINYELPETHELFTHRVGRTARMGRPGKAITMVAATDLTKWQSIERGLGVRLPRVDPVTGEAVAKPAITPSRRSKGWGRRRMTYRRVSA